MPVVARQHRAKERRYVLTLLVVAREGKGWRKGVLGVVFANKTYLDPLCHAIIAEVTCLEASRESPGHSYSYLAVTFPISFPLTSNENFITAEDRVTTRSKFTSQYFCPSIPSTL
jgi:hypothetical protein